MTTHSLSIRQTKWAAEAETQGWTWLTQSDKDYSIYRHIACGNHQSAQMGHVRAGRIRCNTCWTEKIKLEASLKGLEWLHQIDGNFSMYRHSACGHENIHETGKVRKGKVKCLRCQQNLWSDQAISKGWVWLKKTEDVNRSLYRHTCGHEQSHQMTAVRNGSVACHNCEDSWATKPSSVYLIRIAIDDVLFLKVGIARDVGIRLGNYGLPERAEVKIVRTVAYETGREAVVQEKRIHRTIVHHPSVSRFDASYWMKSGHTECYGYSKEAENALSHAVLVGGVC